ncbi:hypothetical protein G6F55_011185 [Rhizopus delemar]|uniref:CCHC-type domain-containing protein n=3 Tax=Rhizopus TaxID=4842 RepID=I1CPP6_RHIO9|nr:hypothetical protein RO3G_15137 [Rhizopus delemar RA 99-880]KAG1165502.1 hypothetical protein G6F36_013319 [Rhizopus arrhizus]KAG1447259.1 hypothetical protein G6F55_011185 [Rhizopus delemar]KAG1491099.1 hypothetical protein G6F54_010256 [Rhizopus delemar]KAG1500546.1 hypothetical protein G6F53_011279 [Rhizopus delemar]|eukprot:EIE90426.1 hypothetical protein RO3G_15137 [Rhizopus delemar RA 99-880]
MSLTHAVNWKFSSITDLQNNQEDRNCDSLVYAHWRSMPPYCRYCHSSHHAIADCPVKLSLITCFHCNEKGHMSRGCPRKNVPANSSTPHKKSRKTPPQSSPFFRKPVASTDSSVSDPSPLPDSGTASIDDLERTNPAEATVLPVPTAASTAPSTKKLGTAASRFATPRVTRSQTAQLTHSSSLPDTAISSDPIAAVCSSCRQSDHKTKANRRCPFNAKNLALIESLVDSEMNADQMELDAESSLPDHPPALSPPSHQEMNENNVSNQQ